MTLSYFDVRKSAEFIIDSDGCTIKVMVGHTLVGERTIRISEYHGEKLPRRLISNSVQKFLVELIARREQGLTLQDWDVVDVVRCKIKFAKDYFKG